jgi:hypothetical protein
MQLPAQDFLRLVERAGSLVFFDLEATGLKGDYNSILVVSAKPFGKAPATTRVTQIGNDQRVVREAKDMLENADAWVSYYGKGFDIPMLNTRLMKWGFKPIEKRPHIDMYYTLKSNLLTGRRSQAHLLEWLETRQQKMSIGASVWADMPFKPENLGVMVKRCESDVKGLEALYGRTRHLIADIKR